MGKLIIIASGKGGTGKTTVTSHIGACLAEKGHLIALVDADMGFRNLDIALGMESNIVFDYSDFINGRADFDDILIKSPTQKNLYLVAAPQSATAIDFVAENIEKRISLFWDNMKSRFEYVIADAPAGIGAGFMFAAKYANEAVVVVSPETASLRDGDRVITELENQGIEMIRLIINRIKPELIESKIMINVDDCIDALSIPLLGLIPDDEAVTESMLKGQPLLDSSNDGAGRAFLNISDRLMGNQVPIMSFDKINKTSRWKKLREIILGK